jgi:hypothetical protein
LPPWADAAYFNHRPRRQWDLLHGAGAKLHTPPFLLLLRPLPLLIATPIETWRLTWKESISEPGTAKNPALQSFRAGLSFMTMIGGPQRTHGRSTICRREEGWTNRGGGVAARPCQYSVGGCRQRHGAVNSDRLFHSKGEPRQTFTGQVIKQPAADFSGRVSGTGPQRHRYIRGGGYDRSPCLVVGGRPMVRTLFRGSSRVCDRDHTMSECAPARRAQDCGSIWRRSRYGATDQPPFRRRKRKRVKRRPKVTSFPGPPPGTSTTWSTTWADNFTPRVDAGVRITCG